MNNNSRFSSLIQKNQNNNLCKDNFSSENRRENYKENKRDDRSFYKDTNDKDDRFYERQKRLHYENEERKKEKVKKTLLSMEHFPELVQTYTKIATENTNTFLEKLKTVKVEEKTLQNVLLPGWISITNDVKTNHTRMVSNYVKKPGKSFGDLAVETMDRLVCLHEKRTEQYIEDYGYEEWEEQFCFPNYDYGYFDRLDEIYEQNMSDSEEEYDSDGYTQYDELEHWQKY
jgi:hypothetical protein